MITMLRPGSSDAIRKAVAGAKVAPEHFLLGPELPDISSTAAREASARGDIDALLVLLHPAVADELLRGDGHAGLPPAAADAPAAAALTAMGRQPSRASLAFGGAIPPEAEAVASAIGSSISPGSPAIPET